MPQEKSATSDYKMRWGGLLEIPVVSRIHRACLDGGKVDALARVLKKYDLADLLDVGCGLGENSVIKREIRYLGLDNSFSRVLYASRCYRQRYFICGNAFNLPFKDRCFDSSLLANTSHHLNDKDFRETLLEMKRVTKRYLIIDDAVKTEGQGRFSAFLYNLDRGGHYRYQKEMREILISLGNVRLLGADHFVTFPGFYSHVVFVLEVIS
ncbi:MAG TPA: class I SAM-dependent methyltransferase [Candidatus Omnitrophota bacterium]|nr:class I SAM-dependent methyltransferase [Candidatus Omnitrophota bacterium]HPD84940.1 class I SAM-dependent methyltransferase [Candidatus Omnitrophota bacterium]HRZ03798.1 class I SAM-dependent methyltransferase [Candidatus Omnitrophota bacterium]